MLKRIYIHNYRTFVNFEWSPPKACVLVGENGSGKSSLMDVLVALKMLLIFGHSVIELDFASVRTQWLKESDQKFEIEIEDEGEAFRYLLTHRSNGGHSSIWEELYRNGVLTVSYTHLVLRGRWSRPATSPRPAEVVLALTRASWRPASLSICSTARTSSCPSSRAPTPPQWP